MKQQILSSTEVAQMNTIGKNNLTEKFSLVAMALFLLVLSIMDCRINDKFSTPYMDQPTLAAANANRNSFSSSAQDFYNLFNFQNRLNMSSEGLLDKKKLFASNSKKHSRKTSMSAGSESGAHGLAIQYNKRNNELDGAVKEYVVNGKRNSKIIKHIMTAKSGFKARGFHFSSDLIYGVEIGVTQNGFYNNTTQNIMTNGIQVGAILNMPLCNHFAFQPGIKYIMKGNEVVTSTSSPEADITTLNKVIMHYAEIPVNLVYKFGKPNTTRVIAGAGPYVSYLVTTKDKIQTTTISDNGISTSKSTGSSVAAPVAGGEGMGGAPAIQNNTSMRKLDYGLNAFVGCETPQGFYAKAAMETGFRDLQQDATDSRYQNRNLNFVISVGYLLGRAK